eukprot:2889668-Rhodomonas_salina.2
MLYAIGGWSQIESAAYRQQFPNLLLRQNAHRHALDLEDFLTNLQLSTSAACILRSRTAVDHSRPCSHSSCRELDTRPCDLIAPAFLADVRRYPH